MILRDVIEALRSNEIPDVPYVEVRAFVYLNTRTATPPEDIFIGAFRIQNYEIISDIDGDTYSLDSEVGSYFIYTAEEDTYHYKKGDKILELYQCLYKHKRLKNWINANKEEIANMSYQDMIDELQYDVDLAENDPSAEFILKKHMVHIYKTCIELLKKEQESNDKSSWLNQKDYEQVKKEIDSWPQWKRDYYNEYFINRINN